MVNIICSGGGSVFSDDVTASKAQVVEGYSTITSDSNDEIGEGTMKEVGANDPSVSNGIANSNLYLRMTNGAHRTANATSGYPEVSIPLADLRSTIGFADTANVLEGYTIAGAEGTMPNKGAWNGKVGLTGSVTIPKGYHNGSGKVTRSFQVYPGTIATPAANDQVILTSGKILTGNVNCAGDKNLIAANLKHGVSIFGVTGSYVSPYIYNGGDATALFGSKSFGFKINAGGDYGAAWGGLVSYNTANMTGSFTFNNNLSTYNYGACYLVANKAFDISNYNTLTLSYTATPDATYPGYYFVRIYVGVSASCERLSSDPSTQSYYRLAGPEYDSKVNATASGTDTCVLDLSKAKAKGSLYYPFIYATISHDASYNATVGVKVNSLVLS